MPKSLDVWLWGHLVGSLEPVDGRLAFAYAAPWLQQAAAQGGEGMALSQSLPLRPEPFDDRATRPFFAGLLPEGEQRRMVAKLLQASRQNDFALLDGIGGECAGAVTLLPPGQPPERMGAAPPAEAVQWLDEADWRLLLDELPRRPMLAGQAGLRLSLAGVDT